MNAPNPAPALPRRDLMKTALLASLAAVLAKPAFGLVGRKKKVLLRSSWQTVNIGDIAHTPGVLALLEKSLHEVEVTLWPSNVGDGVEEMLLRRFPKLRILKTEAEVTEAIAEHDFLLHGSGPYMVGWQEVKRWVETTGKPFGVFGITLWKYTEPGNDPVFNLVTHLLPKAQFVFYRDSASMAMAKRLGLASKNDAFGPDGAFSCDVASSAAADAYLAETGLVPGKFLCCIPKYRFTPYWWIHPERKIEPEKHARNEAMKENDHLPLRRAIEAVVEKTDMKILLCPEDRTQMRVGKEMIYDRLSDAVKKRVVWRENYWLTDVALSVYRKSAGLFGNEQHSPIMCIGEGIPACVGRWAEQSTKGVMWKDIGLGDWLFDMDVEADRLRYPKAVLEIAMNPEAAKAKARAAREKVRAAQKRMTETLSRALA